MSEIRQDELVPVQEMEAGTLIESSVKVPGGFRSVLFRLTGDGCSYREAAVHSPSEFLWGVETFGKWNKTFRSDHEDGYVTFMGEGMEGFSGLTVGCDLNGGRPEFWVSGSARPFQTTETIDE